MPTSGVPISTKKKLVVLLQAYIELVSNFAALRLMVAKPRGEVRTYTLIYGL